MKGDETAIALLSNMHHPSEAFPAEEIVTMVKIVSESFGSVRAAGPQLLSSMRRWLTRFFGRQPAHGTQRRRTANQAV